MVRTMDKVKERVEYKGGVKWIYRYNKQRPKDAVKPQRLANAFYLSTYKCNRCGGEWSGAGESPPLNEAPCIFSICGNPSLIAMLLRSLVGR